MKREELPIKLFRYRPGHVPLDEVDAVLIRGMTKMEVLEAADSWQDVREKLREDLDRAGIVPGSDDYPESLHWDWFNKLLIKSMGRPEPHVFCGIKTASRWEGLLLTKYGEGRTARLDPDADKRLVYGDFMETAVWNMSIPVLGRTSELVGVGAVFMREMIEESMILNFEGRIGLHSLPKAERRYRKWGMTDLGPDARYRDLLYFEFTTEQARAFLSGGA